MSERTFVDRHGVEVFTRWWTTEQARATVLVSHGGAEHSGRYERFASALNAQGFNAVALDMRGHGRTGPGLPRGVMGPGGGEALIDDVHQLRAEVAAELGGELPLFVFGHSLGTLVTLAYLSRHAKGLAGAVLCGVPANVDDTQTLAGLLEGAMTGGMRDTPLGTFGDPNAPFEPARTPFDWLSRDTVEVDRYASDPLCGDDIPVTFGFANDLYEVVAPARHQLGAVTCPALIISGSQDSAGGMGADAVRLADALRELDIAVELRVYDEARHELLNETNRDQVTTDIITWLQTKTR